MNPAKQQEVRGTVLDFKKKNAFFASIRIQDGEKLIRIIGRPPENLSAGQNLHAIGTWESHDVYGPQFQASSISPTEDTVELQGFIENVNHYNPRTRYGVIRIIDNTGKSHSILGEMAYPHVGNEVWLEGKMETHQQYGPQIKLKTIISIPRSRTAIYATLLHYEMKREDIDTLYQTFGSDTIWVMRYHSNRLIDLPLDGDKLHEILEQWEYHNNREAIAQELQKYNLQMFTDAILGQFSADAIRIVEQEPYRLIEVKGIGFQTAERIGKQVGIPHNHPQRISAAITSALRDLSGDGHTCAPQEVLVRKAQYLCGIDTEAIENLLKKAIVTGKLCLHRNKAGEILIYLPYYFELEKQCAQYLENIKNSPSSIPGIQQIRDWKGFLHVLSQENAVSLTEQQTGAVINALKEKLSILTGGPGTGKTTTLRMVINGLKASGARLSLAAPTGKAAKRLAESSGQEVKTIHRLLGWNEEQQGFTYNASNRLPTDALLIDEASMIDIEILKAVLEALPSNAHLVFVGDIYQLPSVGPGNVLRDLIQSEKIAITELNQVFRQATTSRIVANAYHINNGEELEIVNKDTDFYLFKIGEKQIGEMICQIITERLERVYGAFDPMRDIQVLAPMKRGASGITNLNQLLQEALNPNPIGAAKRGKQEFRLKDKIIATRNNYDKDVFNGDQGFVKSINHKNEVISINFDDKLVDYTFAEAFEELILSYCISTHRSQGSEYPVVIIPVSSEHGIMLQRNLLYTAVTRGKKMVILVGNEEAIKTSIKTTSNTERHTGLKDRIR